MGEGADSDKVRSKKDNERQVKVNIKAKLVEDIVKAAKREKFGFPDEKLRPAVNSLIETYGIDDDAYKWITGDNFAVLVNFLIESPRKGKDGCSSPIRSGEKVYGNHHEDQITVRHSSSATGSRLIQSASNAIEQRSLQKIPEQRSLQKIPEQKSFRNTHSVTNDTERKHHRDEHLADGASKKKLKPSRSYADCKPNNEHIRKTLLEQDNGISPIIVPQGRFNGVSSSERKLPPIPSASSSAMSREKECNTSNKINRSLQMHKSVRTVNFNASSDAEMSCRVREADKIRISNSNSNTDSSKEHNSINRQCSVIPLLKDNEFSRLKTTNDASHALEKQVPLIQKSEKSLNVSNSTNVDEGQRMRYRDLRNSSDRRNEDLKMTSKVHSVGIVGNDIETEKDKKMLHGNSQKSINKQIHSIEAFQSTKTSREHCLRKVKDQNEFTPSFVERDKNSLISCRNTNEESKPKSRDKRKPVSNQQSTSLKDLASSLKEHHAGNAEDINEEVLLPNQKMNTIIPSADPNKPNKNDAFVSLQNDNYVPGCPNVKDSHNRKKESIKEKVCNQLCPPLLRELKDVACECVKTSNGLLKTDMSAKAVNFFLEWKKQSSKGKAELHSNDTVQDNSFHKQGTSKTGEVAQVRKKNRVSIYDQAVADGNLLSLDISRGLEKKKITCVNEYDDTFFPEDFVYISKSVITADAHVDLSLSRIGDMHCACSGNCLMLTTPCKCTNDTRGEYAYDKDGLLILRLATNYCFQDGRMNRADFITECTPICPCDMECGNRIVQRGLKYQLQVFMTNGGKGWGVRTLERIVARSFLFEYIGEIMTNTEQYYRNEEYKGKNIHTYQMLLNADYDMETKHFKDGLNDDEALTLDATRYGNVSRFVNHRCEDPNMLIRPVQIDSRDTHYYHVAFFAARDIDEMEELTWDYGIGFDDDHEVIGFRCLCGSSQCRDPRKKACQKS